MANLNVTKVRFIKTLKSTFAYLERRKWLRAAFVFKTTNGVRNCRTSVINRFIAIDNGIPDESPETYSGTIFTEDPKNHLGPHTAGDLGLGGTHNNEYLKQNGGAFVKTWIDIEFRNLKDCMKVWPYCTQSDWGISPKIAQGSWSAMNGRATVRQPEGINPMIDATEVKRPKADSSDYPELRYPSIFHLFFNAASLLWAIIAYEALMLHRNNKRLFIIAIPMLMTLVTLAISAPCFCWIRYMHSFRVRPSIVSPPLKSLWEPMAHAKSESFRQATEEIGKARG